MKCAHIEKGKPKENLILGHTCCKKGSERRAGRKEAVERGGTVGGKKETGAEGRNSNGDRQV